MAGLSCSAGVAISQKPSFRPIRRTAIHLTNLQILQFRSVCRRVRLHMLQCSAHPTDPEACSSHDSGQTSNDVQESRARADARSAHRGGSLSGRARHRLFSTCRYSVENFFNGVQLLQTVRYKLSTLMDAILFSVVNIQLRTVFSTQQVTYIFR